MEPVNRHPVPFTHFRLPAPSDPSPEPWRVVQAAGLLRASEIEKALDQSASFGRRSGVTLPPASSSGSGKAIISATESSREAMIVQFTVGSFEQQP